MAEAELYPPVKRFLERQGYTVKGEVDGCDIVAVRGDEPPVIVELKQRLTLALVLQGVDRARLSDTVYLAFGENDGKGAAFRSRRKQVLALLRRLGFGLLTVSASGNVTPVLDPAPYRPRPDKRRRARLLKEFVERVGDPEPGGSATRVRLTAYRQDALRCARQLAENGTLKASVVRDQSGVQRAAGILQANHYGWFDRIERGHYALSPKGECELPDWAAALAVIADADDHADAADPDDR